MIYGFIYIGLRYTLFAELYYISTGRHKFPGRLYQWFGKWRARMHFWTLDGASRPNSVTCLLGSRILHAGTILEEESTEFSACLWNMQRYLHSIQWTRLEYNYHYEKPQKVFVLGIRISYIYRFSGMLKILFIITIKTTFILLHSVFYWSTLNLAKDVQRQLTGKYYKKRLFQFVWDSILSSFKALNK